MSNIKNMDCKKCNSWIAQCDCFKSFSYPINNNIFEPEIGEILNFKADDFNENGYNFFQCPF